MKHLSIFMAIMVLTFIAFFPAAARADDKGLDDLKLALVKSMDIKPERHYFYEKDHAQPVRLMNMTGG